MFSYPGKLHTLTAAAGEGQLAVFHGAAGLAACLGAEGLRHLHLGQVDDRITVVANEVHMGIGVGIEPFDTVDCTEADDLALLFKPSQVSVDCAKAQIRDLGFELVEDPVGAGVDIRSF